MSEKTVPLDYWRCEVRFHEYEDGKAPADTTVEGTIRKFASRYKTFCPAQIADDKWPELPTNAKAYRETPVVWIRQWFAWAKSQGKLTPVGEPLVQSQAEINAAKRAAAKADKEAKAKAAADAKAEKQAKAAAAKEAKAKAAADAKAKAADAKNGKAAA